MEIDLNINGGIVAHEPYRCEPNCGHKVDAHAVVDGSTRSRKLEKEETFTKTEGQFYQSQEKTNVQTKRTRQAPAA